MGQVAGGSSEGFENHLDQLVNYWPHFSLCFCLCRFKQSSAVWETKRPLLRLHYRHSVPAGHHTRLWDQRQVHEQPNSTLQELQPVRISFVSR